MEPFITTYTGKKVNPLDLHPEDICLKDIAHHLALLNRFVGATRHPVSIAQHSLYVSKLLHSTKWEKEGLFHDAPEAYLGDVSKWVKQSNDMSAYRIAENKAWGVICMALHLDIVGTPENIPIMREADDLMVRFEALRECDHNCHMFELDSHPRPGVAEIQRVGHWAPWTWREAEKNFLFQAQILGFRP